MRGTLILIVDTTYANELASELARLQQDLVGDGWSVIRHDLSRTSAPPQVKGLIQWDYRANQENVKSVFLFGHVPAVYSGSLNPDGHQEHLGAWPADANFRRNRVRSGKSKSVSKPKQAKFTMSDAPRISWNGRRFRPFLEMVQQLRCKTA